MDGTTFGSGRRQSTGGKVSKTERSTSTMRARPSSPLTRPRMEVHMQASIFSPGGLLMAHHQLLALECSSMDLRLEPRHWADIDPMSAMRLAITPDAPM